MACLYVRAKGLLELRGRRACGQPSGFQDLEDLIDFRLANQRRAEWDESSVFHTLNAPPPLRPCSSHEPCTGRKSSGTSFRVLVKAECPVPSSGAGGCACYRCFGPLPLSARCNRKPVSTSLRQFP